MTSGWIEFGRLFGTVFLAQMTAFVVLAHFDKWHRWRHRPRCEMCRSDQVTRFRISFDGRSPPRKIDLCEACFAEAAEMDIRQEDRN